MKTIQEQIAVMQHFANGGKVEFCASAGWLACPAPSWNWLLFDYRIAEEADPYAELKKAAADPTKQIRCWRVNKWGVWQDSNLAWVWNLPVDCYEIRDKPKPMKKVKLLAWFDGELLFWRTEGCFGNSLLTRVPAEDKIIGVEDN
jgi:hypothetical protein